jgi:sugar O-acyltransferase (sialic acid O-acetyltransferase NeuD family)
MKKKPVIIIGAGGHAKVLIDTLKSQSVNIIGMTDTDLNKVGKTILGVPVIGDDTVVDNYNNDSVELVNGIGMVANKKTRQQIFDNFKKRGYSFASVIHHSVILASDVELSEGIQIMAGSVVQTGCKIGKNSIINSRVSIDHETIIGSHVHVAPGVTLSGEVLIGSGTLVGSGATIIQGVKVGENAIVAAGAVVVRDVPDGATVMGVPAKVVK